MTFTTSVKEEMSKIDCSIIESHYQLEAFIKCGAKIKDSIVITMENASVARKIFKSIKYVFDISPTITIRIQKRFRVKQIYLLTIKNKVDFIKKSLNIHKTKTLLENDEEKIAYLAGAFLAIGNISNPQTSGYHLEYICNTTSMAKDIQKILLYFDLKAKIVERGYKTIVYIKSGENISDLLKMFKATNSLFFFEDIRIYRDHKNMVNRLNNCELSNQTKTIETGLKQLEMISYLRKSDLIDLLEDKTKIIMEIREKYPELSLNEIAEIATKEYNYKIGKSGVNHHLIKINELVKRHKNNNENKS